MQLSRTMHKLSKLVEGGKALALRKFFYPKNGITKKAANPLMNESDSLCVGPNRVDSRREEEGNKKLHI